MKKCVFILMLTTITLVGSAQILPPASPYVNDGPFTVVADSATVPSSKKVVMYHPNAAPAGTKYPVFIFQPGANGLGQSVINVHTYDLYLKHLCTYGYVVVVMDATAAGLPDGADFKKVFSWFKTQFANSSSWVKTYADSTNIFVGGHSFGGVCASALVASDGSPSAVAGIIYFASYPNGSFPVQNVGTYTGYVLDLAGNDDQSTKLADAKAGYNKFTKAHCATFVNITGADHGTFGDYVNTSQPVGAIGRVNATATVRHYLVSYLEAYAKGNAAANANLNIAANRPSTTTEFINPCAIANAITDSKDDESLIVSPNPSNGIFRVLSIQNEIANIHIYNVLGECVYKIQDQNINNSTIDLSGKSNGVYFMDIKTEKGTTSKKIIINK